MTSLFFLLFKTLAAISSIASQNSLKLSFHQHFNHFSRSVCHTSYISACRFYHFLTVPCQLPCSTHVLDFIYT